MSFTERLLANAADYTPPPPLPPGARVAIVACMDTRIDVYAIFGLAPGDAHVIRNAGGIVTDDTIRSLAISQRLLGTTEIVLVHHTGCGMTTFNDESFAAQLKSDTGLEPSWSAGAFTDVETDLQDSLHRIAASPFIPEKGATRAFVYDIDSGKLRELSRR